MNEKSDGCTSTEDSNELYWNIHKSITQMSLQTGEEKGRRVSQDKHAFSKPPKNVLLFTKLNSQSLDYTYTEWVKVSHTPVTIHPPCSAELYKEFPL